MSAVHQLHAALRKEVDHLIGHARADALLATGGQERVLAEHEQIHYRIGFAAGRLTTLEEIRALLHLERPDP